MGKLENEYGDVYGYVRCSTKDQKEDRQIDAMLDYGVDPSHIFVEHISGKNFNRPEYKKLIRVIRKGDIIVIKSIDRLGRNYDDIIDQWRIITQDIGCGIHVIDMPTLNTSGDPTDLLSRFITDMMLQVLSFVAENERTNTPQRQREGLEAAKRRGNIKLGRPRVKIPFSFWEVYISWKTGEVKPKKLIAYCKEHYNMGSRMFYRRIRELDMRYGDIPPTKLRDIIIEDKTMEEGFEFSMERCEAAVGIYSSYTNVPEWVENHKRKVAKKEEEESDETELKRIILEKRQAEFKEQFGANPNSTSIERGRNARKKNISRTTIID